MQQTSCYPHKITEVIEKMVIAVHHAEISDEERERRFENIRQVAGEILYDILSDPERAKQLAENKKRMKEIYG